MFIADIEVFGSENAFKAWLQQPNIALGDDKPIDLLSTPYGAELVEDALEAMEYGNADARIYAELSQDNWKDIFWHTDPWIR